jgi:hypothetical protein
MRVIAAVLFAVLILGVPVWLVARAWRTYLRLDVNCRAKLVRMRIGLALISVSAATWIVMFALIALAHYSVAVRFVLQNVPPMVPGLINILLCVAAFGCSEAWRNSADENRALKRAIGVSSGALILVWLFLLANPD